MKLNTRVRYGTRAMLELAQHYGEVPRSLAQVAEAQNLSPKYLEALFRDLRTAGLLIARRGPQGGYALARPPEQINLRDISDVLDGQEPFVPCTADSGVCQRSDTCVARDVWARMYRAAMQVLESTTLADMVVQAQEEWSGEVVYQI